MTHCEKNIGNHCQFAIAATVHSSLLHFVIKDLHTSFLCYLNHFLSYFHAVKLKSNGNFEEELPKKPISRVLVNSLPTANQQVKKKEKLHRQNFLRMIIHRREGKTSGKNVRAKLFE